MNYIGIDPSLRHTGLCYRVSGRPDFVYHEIKTGKLSIHESILQIRRELITFFPDLMNDEIIFGIERQIPNASGSSGGVQFLIYMVIIDIIDAFYPNTVNLISPYPVQLKAYMGKIHKVKNINDKKSIKERFFELTGKALSDHIAEAWFLTLMSEDIIKKNWILSFKPTRYRLFPKDWRVHGEK